MPKFNLSDMSATVLDVRNNNTLSIKHGFSREFLLDISEIRRIYFRKPRIGRAGFIYISLNGAIVDYPSLSKRTIEFGWRFKRDTLDFFDALLIQNENIEFIKVTRYYDMYRDRAVKRNRISPICPACHSIFVAFKGHKRKRYYVNKSILNYVDADKLGGLADFAGERGLDRWRCQECGEKFTTRLE